jgi:hypothetical protein
MRCSKCGTESTADRKFCPECGSPLSNRCTKCGAENSSTAKFCEDCGAPLGLASPASAKKANDSPIRVADTLANEHIEGERKTVTTLLADIKGSMELIEDRDPEEARAIVDPALKLMMEAVQRYGGYVAQPTGDGIFALFGARVAHEDHARRSLLAALRMQAELKRYSNRIRAEGRLPIQARVGVNTGEVVVRSITTGEGRRSTPTTRSGACSERLDRIELRSLRKFLWTLATGRANRDDLVASKVIVVLSRLIISAR